ncbi:MAG: hypothetical protein GF308_11900 [Candidatus Heimdallarchaeota archaeon]|nr:hypothetical protein [Candidatus Heimdallarchaeota archaeon]
MKGEKKLLKILKKKKYQRAAIVGHTSADPDSIASTCGMRFILKCLHPERTVDILVDGVSKATKKLVEYLNYSFITQVPNDRYDLIIIVDVNVPTQLGIFKDFILEHNKKSLIIIDHHTPTNFSQKKVGLSIIDEERFSVSEMVTELIFDLSLEPPKKLLNGLLAGIIYDSRRFYSLQPEVLDILTKMFDYNVNYDLAVSLLQKRFDYSERVARIKCGSRLKIKRINKWIIVWSNIGSHEGSCARGLLDLGADVALVYSRRKNETRFGVRATQEFYHKTNLHFGKEIMNVIAEEYGGDGGGHSTAAALNIPKIVPQQEIVSKALTIIRKKIHKAKLKPE